MVERNACSEPTQNGAARTFQRFASLTYHIQGWMIRGKEGVGPTCEVRDGMGEDPLLK